MIDLIIWSKDRPAQLHLLLDSIQKYMPNAFKTTVIYTYTSEAYKQGYDEIIVNKTLQDEVARCMFGFKYESDFRTDTMEVIGLSDRFVCFSTDDTVLTRPAEFKPEYMDRVATFSLRLGFNTIEQDIHAGTQQPPLNTYDDEGDTISWFFGDYHPHHNYGYPFGLDMHVYHKKDIYDLTRYMPFKNTNELETGLFHKKLCVSPRMRSFKESVAVNVPVNSISGVTRAGEVHGSPTEFLNSEYLSGKRISLDAVSNEKIVGCHQEIKLEWVNG